MMFRQKLTFKKNRSSVPDMQRYSWLRFVPMIAIVGLISLGGIKYTAGSSASSTLPTGAVDIITYSGSIAGGNEIGSVYVLMDQGGSGVQCSPRDGVTDSNGGGNHGHLHLTCPAASSGGP